MCALLTLLSGSGRTVSLKKSVIILSSCSPSVFYFIPETRTDDRLLYCSKLATACSNWSMRLPRGCSTWSKRCFFSFSVFPSSLSRSFISFATISDEVLSTLSRMFRVERTSSSFSASFTCCISSAFTVTTTYTFQTN